MFRWFGNMLRTNGRALKLGPVRAGLFPWWCILDQRISMWTALTGPVFAVFLALQHGAAFIPIYLVWVGFTRWVMSLMVFAVRGEVSWRTPFLIYYNQIWGSLVKTYILFRLDRQSWTRQKTKLERHLTPLQRRLQAVTSSVSFAAAMMVFLCVVGFLSGALRVAII
jgi:glycosyltransferase Alg8